MAAQQKAAMQPMFRTSNLGLINFGFWLGPPPHLKHDLFTFVHVELFSFHFPPANLLKVPTPNTVNELGEEDEPRSCCWRNMRSVVSEPSG